jgi:hypothetical protein
MSFALILKTTEQGSVDLQNNCVVKTVDSNIASKVDQMAKDGAKVIYKMHVYFHIQNFIGDLLEEEKASVYKPLSWVCTTGRHGRSLLLLLAIKNIPKLSFVHLYRDRFSVTCSTEMFLTQRNISYGFSNREPECVVYRIILRLRSTLNFGKFPKFKTYQCGRKAYGRIREKANFFFIFCN